MTTKRQVSILAAAAILRGLRIRLDMRFVLNGLASELIRIAADEQEKRVGRIRRQLAILRDALHRLPSLDDLILGNALEGVILLLLPE